MYGLENRAKWISYSVLVIEKNCNSSNAFLCVYLSSQAGADLMIRGPKQISGTAPHHNNYNALLRVTLIFLASSLSL